MDDQALARLLITSSLAFLAFLPSAVALLLSSYNRQRYSEFTGRRWELNWHRRAIFGLLGGMYLIVWTYLISLNVLVDYVSYFFDGFPGPVLSGLNIAIFLLSLGIAVMTVSMTVFIYRHFVQLGDLRSITEALSSMCEGDRS